MSREPIHESSSDRIVAVSSKWEYLLIRSDEQLGGRPVWQAHDSFKWPDKDSGFEPYGMPNGVLAVLENGRSRPADISEMGSAQLAIIHLLEGNDQLASSVDEDGWFRNSAIQVHVDLVEGTPILVERLRRE